MNLTTILLIILIVLVLFIIFCWVFKWCKKCRHQDDNPTVASKIPKQMIVEFKDATDKIKKDVARKKFIAKMQKEFPTFDIIVKHCRCNNLELWEANMELTINGQEGTVGGKGSPGGEGFPIEFISSISHNFNLDNFDKSKDFNEDYQREKDTRGTYSTHHTPVLTYTRATTDPVLKIAIMDTGLDATKINSLGLILEPTAGACPDGSWNFVDDSTIYHDDHANQHGTWVTQFLLTELGPKNVELLALKVLNKDNQGTLFDLLCAINYCIEKNVHAINMSLGYYGDEIALLRKYMEKLANKNIWVFAAAGNVNEQENAEERQLNLNADVGQNLDTRTLKFYPACFSTTLKNIITVTSVKADTKVCNNQNYSPHFVNIGVQADGNCKFRSMVTPQLVAYLTGSSFATPIFAGKALKVLPRSSTIVPAAPAIDRKSLINLTTPTKTTDVGKIEDDNIVS